MTVMGRGGSIPHLLCRYDVVAHPWSSLETTELWLQSTEKMSDIVTRNHGDCNRLHVILPIN